MIQELKRSRIQANRRFSAGLVPVRIKGKTRLVFGETDLVRPCDLAKLAGISTAAVAARHREGKIPPYDIDNGKGRRFWWGATLNEWESPLRRRWLVFRG